MPTVDREATLFFEKCVASKGLTGAIFGCVASKGLADAKSVSVVNTRLGGKSDAKPCGLFFWAPRQARRTGLTGAIFGCVAIKGLTGTNFGCVANKGVSDSSARLRASQRAASSEQEGTEVRDGGQIRSWRATLTRHFNRSVT